MKIAIRSLIAVLSLLAAMSAVAVDTKPFDPATFAALQAANQPVLIDVYADWCPICKQQAPIVGELMANPEFKDFTVLRVNFDTQKDLRRALGVAQQSTFIVYRGRQEVARSIADTNKASIAAALRKALS